MKLKSVALLAACSLACVSPAFAQDAPADPELLRLQKLKAQLDAETQAYVADKAKSDAQAAAATAKLGPLASYTREGTIEAGDNSGKLQATLLAAEATRQSASLIVRDLCTLLRADDTASACGPNGRGVPKLLVFTETERPNFDAYQAFELERIAIARDLARAAALKPGGSRGPISTGTFGGALPVLLSAAGNLFRSDYKLSNLDLSQSDTLLIRALLRQAKQASLHTMIVVPSLYAGPMDLANNPAVLALNALEDSRDEVAAAADRYRAQAAKKPKNKDELDKIVAAQDAAVARFDTFAKKLSTPDDAGRVPIANIARQAELLKGMDETSRYLVIKADYAGGSAYSRKNFWTFLGGMPFYVAGGSLVGYTLFNGKTGEALYSSSLPQAEPYTRIGDATERFAVRHCAGPSGANGSAAAADPTQVC
jgi:hypothetical protein